MKTTIRRSPTLALNELSAQLAAQGRTIYRFGFGQSPFPPPPHVTEALRANAHRRDYLPVQGLPALREAAARFHSERYGINTTAESVVAGPGSKELMFLLQLVMQCELLLPAPSWVSYQPQAALLGLPVTWISTGEGWRIDPDDLHRACSRPARHPRLLILNYPNNPAGTTLDATRLQQIAEVARRHNLTVLSDEIYGELDFTGRHASLARFYPEGTILSSGLSKWCGAGGWRLGVFCFPAELRQLREAVCGAASETFSCVSAPVQYAAITAYQAGDQVEAYLQKARSILCTIGRWAATELNNAGVPTAMPEGGFYLFPDFTPHRDRLAARTSPQLCEKLLSETGVALLPGADFGRPPEELTARLAYVNFDGAACLRDNNTHHPQVQQGIQEILKWLR